MLPHRVLLVHSQKDKGFAARLEQIHNNPALANTTFAHFCIIDPDRPSKILPHLEAADRDFKIFDLNNRLIHDEIQPLLDECISTFKPDVVIIHGGTYFIGPLAQY